MLDAARRLRARGLSVIPIGSDKRPLIEWKTYQEEPPPPDQIDEWFTRWPAANLGVVTGRVSSLVVLDADGPEGLASLKALGTTARTWLQRTGRLEGGWQQAFRHPGNGVTIGNRAGVRPGLDVRGDGGYVVVPPSMHPSGRRYEWLTSPDDVELAELPPHLLELLLTPATGNGQPNTTAEIPQGQRNDTLYRLGRSLVAKGLSREAVAAALIEENRTHCHPPLSEREVRAIAEHVTTQPNQAAFKARTSANGTPPADGLDLVSVGELLGEPDGAPAWIVAQRLPAGGLGMLAGKPKAGKSTLARVLALHVARGEPWLGFPTTGGAVIYLALEEKRQEIRQHFRALGTTSADRIYLLCSAAPGDALARLRREADRRRPVLIIIDPLFRFVRVPAEGGNDYATMSAALEPLLVLARETGAHVLVVHHLGKGRGEDADAILGSTAIFAAVDTAMLLKRSEKYRTLSSIQRYGDDLEEITLSLDPMTRDVTAGPPRATAELAEAGRLILAFLANTQEAVTEAEVDAAIECRTQIRRKALRELVGTGTVVRTGRGGKTDPFRYSCSLHMSGTREQEQSSLALTTEHLRR